MFISEWFTNNDAFSLRQDICINVDNLIYETKQDQIIRCICLFRMRKHVQMVEK